MIISYEKEILIGPREASARLIFLFSVPLDGFVPTKDTVN